MRLWVRSSLSNSARSPPTKLTRSGRGRATPVDACRTLEIVAVVPDQSDTVQRTLREVCERLAPIDTTPCSPGEREAAEWIAGRLGMAGVAGGALGQEPSWGGGPPPPGALGGLGGGGGGL